MSTALLSYNFSDDIQKHRKSIESVKNGEEFASIRDWVDEEITDFIEYSYLQDILIKKSVELKNDILMHDSKIDDSKDNFEF